MAVQDTASLLEEAIDLLNERLPSGWAAEKTVIGSGDTAVDLLIKAPGGVGQTAFMVEARPKVSTRDVQVLLGGPWRRWRTQMSYDLLLVASYIGAAVRTLLKAEDVSYIDLTGNIRIKTNSPPIFVELEGARADPAAPKSRRGLGGAKVGAVVRVLADVCPPYSGSEVAAAANVNEGYMSRILDTLVDEGVIERDRYGPVTAVDWPALLRRRAQVLDLFRPKGSYGYVARQGAQALLADLREVTSSWAGDANGFNPPPTITGSFAASRIAPVAAPAVLVVYTMKPRELAERLPLLPTDAGADTVLVRPDHDVAFWRSRSDGGLMWAAPSQVAIDSLSGSGRMPAEGEALIVWMRENEQLWRAPSIRAQASRL